MALNTARTVGTGQAVRRPLVACVTAALIAAGMVLGTVVPATAQSGCPDYARLALQQARENEQRKCGFAGPDWSTDLKGHMTWCSAVGPADWKAALQRRAQMLATQCKK